MGNTQEIPQGEGGEQGDPLMPMLFSLGEHTALEAIQWRLADGEKLLAYLDDVTVICRPERMGTRPSCTREHPPWKDAGVESWRSCTRGHRRTHQIG